MKFVGFFLFIWLGLVQAKEIDQFIDNYLNFTSELLTQDLYDEKPGNFYISPFSITITAGLLRAGAQGQTAREITEVLQLIGNVDRNVRTIIEPINSNMRGYRSLILSKSNLVRDRFSTIARTYYETEVENLDLSDTAAVAAKINQDCARETREVIQNLIQSSHLKSDGKLYTFSAEAFQGRFAPGPKFTISEGPFYVNARQTRNVETIQAVGTFKYREDNQLKIKVLDLPLTGKDVCLRIVLPDDAEGLKQLEPQTDQILRIDGLTKQKLSVTIPKFIISSVWHQDFLSERVPSLFSKDKADLRGISGEKGDLEVTLMTQKAYIRLDQRGLEIAEGPQNDIFPGSLNIPQIAFNADPSIKEFNADHPFYFYILQGRVVHFVGRLNDPTENTYHEN